MGRRRKTALIKKLLKKQGKKRRRSSSSSSSFSASARPRTPREEQPAVAPVLQETQHDLKPYQLQFYQLTAPLLHETMGFFDLNSAKFEVGLKQLKNRVKSHYSQRLKSTNANIRRDAHKRMDLWARISRGFGRGMIGRCRDLLGLILGVKMGQRFRKHNGTPFWQIRNDWVAHYADRCVADPLLAGAVQRTYERCVAEATKEREKILRRNKWLKRLVRKEKAAESSAAASEDDDASSVGATKGTPNKARGRPGSSSSSSSPGSGASSRSTSCRSSCTRSSSSSSRSRIREDAQGSIRGLGEFKTTGGK